jgi:hypothetical protein
MRPEAVLSVQGWALPIQASCPRRLRGQRHHQREVRHGYPFFDIPKFKERQIMPEYRLGWYCQQE